MNQRDRTSLRRVSMAARQASDVLPTNPANIARVVAASSLMADVLHDIAFTLGTMADGQGDASDIEALERRVSSTSPRQRLSMNEGEDR